MNPLIILLFSIFCLIPNSFLTKVGPNTTKSSTVNILDTMKSDTEELCLFPSLDLLNSKLLKLCNVDVPLALSNETDISKYLAYDVSPLLCMALYDVSLHLCTLSQLEPELKNKVPNSEASFASLIQSLESNESHNSLTQFCSTVGYNGSLLSINKEKFSKTSLWINYFNIIIKDKCEKICQPTGLITEKVNPLCSFIIWTNTFHKLTEDVKPQLSHESTLDNIDKKGMEIELKRNITKPEKQTYAENVEPPNNAKNVQTTSVKNDQVPSVENKDQFKEDGKVDAKQSPNPNISVTTVNKVTPDTITHSVEITTASTIMVTQSKKQTDEPKASVNGIEKPTEQKETNIEHIEKSNNPPPNISGVEPKEIIKDVPEPQNDENDEEKIRGDDEDTAFQGPEDDSEDYTRPKENIFLSGVEKQKEVKVADDIIMPVEDKFTDAEDSHFFTNFVSLAVLCIIMYLVFHNKKKLVALLVEGKRRGPTRRRPNTASYSKLDCNLEEAMVSNTTASVTHVLY